MISEIFMTDLNYIRETFLESLDQLEKSLSFTTIINSSVSIKQNYELLAGIPEKITVPFENKFVSAIIGSSKKR